MYILRQVFTEDCHVCGRQATCMRRKQVGILSLATIDRVSFSSGSYKRSTASIDFDSLNAKAFILHLREFPFIAHFLMQKLLYTLPLPSNPVLLLILDLPLLQNRPNIIMYSICQCQIFLSLTQFSSHFLFSSGGSL